MILPAIFLLLRLLIETEGGCPIRCNCTENSVNCVSKKLEYVPYFESLTNTPVIIDLSGNAITIIDIDDFSFDKSDEVKEIYLNHSQLTTIEERAFEELENLQELYLNDNYLSSLPEDFLIFNENMVLLDLSNNYFTDMPKINSDSLEVLTIANSGVSRIANDALEGLPNLRILLLQQNNLKSLNTVVFDHMSNFFFIRIAYNPWFCNCKSIKLFDYLSERKFVDLTEAVQCQTEEKIFVDIYNEKGVAPAFENQCSFLENSEETLDITLKKLEKPQDSVTNYTSNEIFVDEDDDEIVSVDENYYLNFFFILLLCFATTVSLITGAVCGSCVTYKYMSRNIRQTESQKELIFHFS